MKFRKILTTVISLCMAVFILAIPVHAEMTSGYVSNLLAPLYGRARTELVDDIGVPVNAKATAGGYELSADAVIGDRYCMAMVFSLRRTDGAAIDPDLHFDSIERKWRTSGGGSGSYRISEDGKSLNYIEQWNFSSRAFPHRKVDIVFSDLVDGEGNPVATGDWALNFTARYKDTTVSVPVFHLSVTDMEGNDYQIQKLLLSPLGVHIKAKAPNPFPDGPNTEPYMQQFRVALRLVNGTLITLEDHHCGLRGDFSKAAVNANWGSMFDEPIPLENIKAIEICGQPVMVR